MVIEDEPVIRRELEILLESAMYQAAAPDEFERGFPRNIELKK